MNDKKIRRFAENMFEISSIAECMQIDGVIQVDDSRELFACVMGWASAFEQQFDNDGSEDYLFAIEDYARRKLLETFPPTEETRSYSDSISGVLPNGLRLIATLGGDIASKNTDENGWASIDVGLAYPDGRYINLCAADYEQAGRLFRKDTLRVMTFRDGEDDPACTYLLDDFVEGKARVDDQNQENGWRVRVFAPPQDKHAPDKCTSEDKTKEPSRAAIQATLLAKRAGIHNRLVGIGIAAMRKGSLAPAKESLVAGRYATMKRIKDARKPELCEICGEHVVDTAAYIAHADSPFVQKLLDNDYFLCRGCFDPLLGDLEKDRVCHDAIIYVEGGFVHWVALPDGQVTDYHVCDRDEMVQADTEDRRTYLYYFLSAQKHGMRIM